MSSNQQKDRDVHDDQRSDSSESVIDVTGTANITQESIHLDAISSKSGLHLERSSKKLQKKSQRYSRKEPVENGEHFKSSNSKLSGRHRAQGDKNTASKNYLSRSRSPTSRTFSSYEYCQENLSTQQPFYSKPDLLQSRSKFRERYHQSRRSRSRSRDSSRKYTFSPYSQNAQKDSYRSGHSYPKSSLEFSQSGSRAHKKDNMTRSRSRSRESNKVLDNGHSRSGKWRTVYRPRSSRSRSKESADLHVVNDSESRRSNKAGITRSRSRSKESNKVLGNGHSRSGKWRTVYRPRSSRSKSKESADLHVFNDSESRRSNKADITRSRSRSRESSNTAGSRRRKSKKSKKKRRSRAVNLSIETSNPQDRSDSRPLEDAKKQVYNLSRSSSRESIYHSASSESRLSKKSRRRSSRSRSPRSRSYKSRSPGSRSYRSSSKDTGTRNSKSNNSMSSKVSGSSMSRSQDSMQVSGARSGNAEKNYESRIDRPRSKESNNFSNRPRSDSVDESDKYHSTSTTKKCRRRVYYQKDSKSKEVSHTEASKSLSNTESKNDSKRKASALHTCRKLGKDVLVCTEHDKSEEQSKRHVLIESPPKLAVIASSKSEQNNSDGDGTAVVEATFAEEDKALQVSEIDDIAHTQATCEKESHPDRNALDQCSGSDVVCQSILAKLDSGVDSRWKTKEEMNIDIIKNRNCIRDLSNDGKQGSKDLEIKHPSTLHIEAVRTRSPEYNPVKDTVQNKSKIVKIKRRPYSRSLVQTHDSGEVESTVRNNKEYDDEAILKTTEKTEYSEGRNIGTLFHSLQRGSELDSTSVGKPLEGETGILNENNNIHIEQNGCNRVNEFLENDTKRVRNTVEVPSMSRDITESQISHPESVSSIVDNGADSLRLTGTSKNKLTPIGLDTNDDIHFHATDEAQLNDQNYLNTIMTKSSLADAEIDTSVKELNHRISQSRETSNGLDYD